MYDILIIGGGPAGLTAAIYARRAGKKCLVLEATACGGQVLNTDKITNYPAVASVSGPELAQNMQQQVLDLGAEIEFDKATMITEIDGGFSVKGCRHFPAQTWPRPRGRASRKRRFLLHDLRRRILQR